MTCGATMDSVANPGHVHSCTSAHNGGDHICSASFCRRWFYTREV